MGAMVYYRWVPALYDNSNWWANVMDILSSLIPLQTRNSWFKVLPLTEIWKVAVPMTPRSTFPPA